MKLFTTAVDKIFTSKFMRKHHTENELEPQNRTFVIVWYLIFGVAFITFITSALIGWYKISKF